MWAKPKEVIVEIPRAGGSIPSQANKIAKTSTMDQQQVETKLVGIPQARGSITSQANKVAKFSS